MDFVARSCDLIAINLLFPKPFDGIHNIELGIKNHQYRIINREH
jgi:hypothetical protein